MSAPDSDVELAQRRMEARNKSEFELADVLRNTIANAGYEVVDVENGFELIEKAAFITLAYARSSSSALKVKAQFYLRAANL